MDLVTRQHHTDTEAKDDTADLMRSMGDWVLSQALQRCQQEFDAPAERPLDALVRQLGCVSLRRQPARAAKHKAAGAVFDRLQRATLQRVKQKQQEGRRVSQGAKVMLCASKMKPCASPTASPSRRSPAMVLRPGPRSGRLARLHPTPVLRALSERPRGSTIEIPVSPRLADVPRLPPCPHPGCQGTGSVTPCGQVSVRGRHSSLERCPFSPEFDHVAGIAASRASLVVAAVAAAIPRNPLYHALE